MGVDYKAIGGIGIEVDDKILALFIENEAFSEKDWDEYGSECLEEIGVEYAEAGSCYSGVTTNYIFVKGNTLGEIQENSAGFIEIVNRFGGGITENDLVLISALYVY